MLCLEERKKLHLTFLLNIAKALHGNRQKTYECKMGFFKERLNLSLTRQSDMHKNHPGNPVDQREVNQELKGVDLHLPAKE